ncbi:MAG: nickel pincer cofactor biosynthesis protein LarC [Clostridia bacterium]|nr:MAG: nickel pincer cofactor biosynthesis protein LarC [Clostridia bacterium]
MKIIYLDAPAGVSGDMVLGALADCGLQREAWLGELERLVQGEAEIRFEEVRRAGLRATRVTVTPRAGQPERRLADIEAIIAASTLPLPVQERSLAVFQALAEAEARVHGVTPGQIHFHEVGAMDALVDVAGVTLALYLLQVEKVFCSPLPLGRGWVNSSHGPLPLPAPATLELLREVPVCPAPVAAETVTPTGAALVKVLTAGFGPLPSMTLEQTGYGAGSRDHPFPNVLRAILGEAGRGLSPGQGWEKDMVAVLETNIDDLNPQVYPVLSEKLLAAGALDVSYTAIGMKKGRPGIALTVLGRPEDVESLSRLIVTETGTLGLRIRQQQRLKVPRGFVAVNTRWGKANVKWSGWSEDSVFRLVRVAPEFEDCRRLAEEAGLPVEVVRQEVAALARQLLTGGAAATSVPPPISHLSPPFSG